MKNSEALNQYENKGPTNWSDRRGRDPGNKYTNKNIIKLSLRGICCNIKILVYCAGIYYSSD